MVKHTYNPSTLGTKAERGQIQGQPGKQRDLGEGGIRSGTKRDGVGEGGVEKERGEERDYSNSNTSDSIATAVNKTSSIAAVSK